MQFIDLVGAVGQPVRHCPGDRGGRHRWTTWISLRPVHIGDLLILKGEREPGIPHQQWRVGRSVRWWRMLGPAPCGCVVGIRDVCGRRPRRQAGDGSRAWLRRPSTRSGVYADARAAAEENASPEEKQAHQGCASGAPGWVACVGSVADWLLSIHLLRPGFLCVAQTKLAALCPPIFAKFRWCVGGEPASSRKQRFFHAGSTRHYA